MISAYALTFGGFLLLGGRVADLLGRAAGLHGRPRRSFAAGSLVAGLAWSETSLIGARAPAGRGAAVISPVRALDPDHHLRARGASATSRSASGAPSAASEPPQASSSAASSPTAQLGVDLLHQHPDRARGSPLTPVLLGESRDGARPLRPLAPSRHLGPPMRSSRSRRRTASAGRRRRRSASSPPPALLDRSSSWTAVEHPLMTSRSSGSRRSPARTWSASSSGRPLLDVPDAHALHAAGARLLGDEDRRRLPGRRGHVDRRGRRSPRSS